MRKLMVAFDKPEHGWSRLQLHCDEAQLSEPFSHIYPTLRELCGALCDLVTGHTSRPVVFLLEPAELELTLTPLDGGMTRLRLCIFESRLRTSDVDAVFEFEVRRQRSRWRSGERCGVFKPICRRLISKKAGASPFPRLRWLR